MPKKKGRKLRWTRPHLQPTAAATAQKRGRMSEAEEPRSRSPSWSRSRSPSLSQPLKPQPDQQYLKPKEEIQNPPQETQAEVQKQRLQDAEEEESQGMAVSPPRPVPVAHDARASNASFQWRAAGKRGKPLSDKKRAVIQEKLDLLDKNLRPVAFAPGKAIDFLRHEQLFKALGLWEFAHADLGGCIRADLLVQLIANYDPQRRHTRVKGARIAVSRPDLARALGLPVKKEKGSLLESKGVDQELFSREDSVSVIMDFMSNWVLFHEDDACILPGEVVMATQLVKEGQAHKIDWSGLIWMMVEKELLEVPASGICLYASHMQCLIKHQKPGIIYGEEQDMMEVSLAEDDDEEANDVAMATTSTLQDIGVSVTEKQDAALCLGLGEAGGILKDATVECQEDEQAHWFHGTKNIHDEHYLQRCNMNGMHSIDSEDVAREEAGIGEQGRYGEDIAAKFSNLEKMTSTDLLQVMNTGNVSYVPLEHMEPSSEEFLLSKPDPLKGMELDACMGGSSFFKVTGKRETDAVDDDDDEISHSSHGNPQKRIRTDEQWDPASLTFGKCMDEAAAWMERAKMVFSQREQEVVSSQMHIQYFNNLLQQKEHEIQILEKTRLEEQHRRQMEICRFEHELGVMARIIQGYRKALMETRCAFAEYRKQFPQGDEQLYRDDDDGGGLVLSTNELKRKQLQKEEARRSAMQMIDDFGRQWLEIFDDYEDQVHQLDKRLVDLTRESNALKKRQAKAVVTDEKQ